MNERAMAAIDSKLKTPVILIVILAAAPLVVFVGCEELALMPRPSLESRSGAGSIALAGVVEGFDFERQEIYIRTQGGQSQIVSYNERTQVSLDGQTVEPSRLGVGDAIEARLREDPSGRTVAESIRIGQAGRARQSTVAGTVERVLTGRDAIELRTPAGELTVVYLPRGSSPRTEEAFRRIRAGDFVRFEGVFLSDNRFELDGVL